MGIITKQDLLIPPDLLQCQAEVPNGTNFMTLGGNIGGRVRCENAPAYVVYETKPAADGLMGSMSLCPSCLEVFKKIMGSKFETHYRLEEINDGV